MITVDVMEAIAARLDTITGLRVYPYPPNKVEVPAAIVGYPETVTFDATYGRGMDRMVLPVVAVVGKVSARTTPELLGAYTDGSGASSFKAVIESGTYTAFDVVRVSDVEFDVVTYAGTDHMAALFTVNIAGQGTS